MKEQTRTFDEEMQGVDAAMRRASLRGREAARRAGTNLVFSENGRIYEISPDELDRRNRLRELGTPDKP